MHPAPLKTFQIDPSGISFTITLPQHRDASVWSSEDVLEGVWIGKGKFHANRFQIQGSDFLRFLKDTLIAFVG